MVIAPKSHRARSYDYARHRGVEEIDWERFARLSRTLIEKLSGRGIDTVVGVARAGLIPAAAVACALRCDLHPVRLTRRRNDRVVRRHPVWTADVPAAVRGRIVAVVDEIADTGETLARVAARVRERGAADVITACLVSHSWARPRPMVVATTTDALVIFPWDRQVCRAGRWRQHPELARAMRLQKRPGCDDARRVRQSAAARASSGEVRIRSR